MPHDSEAPTEERCHLFPQDTIAVEDFSAEGPILDIGGGGEGIIGLLKASQVVAVDLRKSELEEAPDGPLKVIADARDLPFLDSAFGTATAFYSLMYLKTIDDLDAVLSEVHRALRPGGRFFIWDVAVDRPAEATKPIYVVPLRVRVAGREIETGYGQPWPDPPRGTALYRSRAGAAGFEVVQSTEDGMHFALELRKPSMERGNG